MANNPSVAVPVQQPGTTIEVVKPDGSNVRQVVVVGDPTNAGAIAAVNAADQLLVSMQGSTTEELLGVLILEVRALRTAVVSLIAEGGGRESDFDPQSPDYQPIV